MEIFYQKNPMLIYLQCSSIIFDGHTVLLTLLVCWDELHFSRMFPVKSCLKNHLTGFKGSMKPMIWWSLLLLGLLLLLSLLLFWMQPYALGILKRMCSRSSYQEGLGKLWCCALILMKAEISHKNTPWSPHVVELCDYTKSNHRTCGQ